MARASKSGIRFGARQVAVPGESTGKGAGGLSSRQAVIERPRQIVSFLQDAASCEHVRNVVDLRQNDAVSIVPSQGRGDANAITEPLRSRFFRQVHTARDRAAAAW